MAQEIERKFLVVDDSWRDQVRDSKTYRQGYLSGSEKSSVRVRVAGERAHLNIKSATIGVQRMEYEYEIPVADGEEMLDSLCEGPLIEKTRYFIDIEGHTWELDVFAGDNEGLVVAEIELAAVDEAFSKPGWAGREVSEDVRYFNHALSKHPYSEWKHEA